LNSFGFNHNYLEAFKERKIEMIGRRDNHVTIKSASIGQDKIVESNWFFLGFGILTAWMAFVYSNRIYSGHTLAGAAQLDLFPTVFAWSSIAAAVMVFGVSKRLPFLLHKKLFLGLAAVLLLVGTFAYDLVFILNVLDYPIIGFIGAGFCGTGYVLVLILWFVFFSRQGIVTTTYCILISQVIGFGTAQFLHDLSPVYLSCALIALAILSVLTISMSLQAQFVPPCASIEEQSVRLPWKVFIVQFICGLALAFSAQMIGGMSSTTHCLATLIATFLMLAGTMMLAERFKLGILPKIGLPIITLGLLLFLILGENLAVVSQFIVVLGATIYLTFFTLFFCLFSNRTGYSPERLGSIFLICKTLSAVLVYEGSLHIDLHDMVLSNVIIVVLIIAICISTIVCIDDEPLQVFTKRYIHRKDELDQSIDFSGSDNFPAFCKRYNIGTRETDVLKLLLHGKSTSEISEKLFIAKGTVKAHIHSIYRKLDIHNRDELASVIDSFVVGE
jgi:hypothetical protein